MAHHLPPLPGLPAAAYWRLGKPRQGSPVCLGGSDWEQTPPEDALCTGFAKSSVGGARGKIRCGCSAHSLQVGSIPPPPAPRLCSWPGDTGAGLAPRSVGAQDLRESWRTDPSPCKASHKTLRSRPHSLRSCCPPVPRGAGPQAARLRPCSWGRAPF